MSEYPELDRLLSRYLDGSASRDDMATLETQLAADEKFAEHFARWCLTHRQVSELLTESKLHQLMDQCVKSAPGFPKDALRPKRPPQHAASGGNPRALAWAALAG